MIKFRKIIAAAAATAIALTSVVIFPSDLQNISSGIIASAEYDESEIISGWSGCVTWTLTPDGTLTISGYGEMDDYRGREEGNDDYPEYTRDEITNSIPIKKVIIEDGVTSIGECAFANCTMLESVEIPDSVDYIGKYAFENCEKLTYVKMNAGYVQEMAFASCTSLESIYFGYKLQGVEEKVLAGCENIKRIKVPCNFDESNLFYTDDYYGTLTYHSTPTYGRCNSIYNDRYMFMYLLPGIEENTDYNNFGVFLNSHNWNSLHNEDGLYDESNNVCLTCDSSAVSSLEVNGNIEYYDNSAEAWVEANETDQISTIRLYRDIERGGFSRPNALTMSPDAVINLYLDDFTYSGYWAENDPDNVLIQVSGTLNIYGGTIEADGGTAIECLSGGTLNIYDVTIKGTNDGLDIADDSNFKLSGGEITGDNRALNISKDKFRDSIETGYCLYYESNNPIHGSTAVYERETGYRYEGVAELYDPYYDLSEVISAYKITVKPCTHEQSSIIDSVCSTCGMKLPPDEYGQIVDLGKTNNLSWKLYISNNNETDTADLLVVSGSGSIESVDDLPYFLNKEEITSVIIEEGITSIGENAFRDFHSLTNITIPDSVTSIGEWAFSNCDSLTTVTIPDSVTYIGEDAFRYCHSLTTITIPNSVTTINDRAFYYCDNLTSIEIPDSVTYIGENAFDGCDNLTNITISCKTNFVGTVSTNCTLTYIHDSQTELNSDETGHWYICANCGEKVNFSSHISDSGVVTTPATTASTGVRTYTCTVCGDVIRTEEIPMLEDGHEHSYSLAYDGTSHWNECSCGDKKDIESHDMSEWETEAEPTCTASGTKTRSCTVCEYVETASVDALGHDADTEWTSDESDHWYICHNDLTEQLVKASHTEDSGVVTTEATTTSTGVKTYSCTVCGYVTGTETIPVISSGNSSSGSSSTDSSSTTDGSYTGEAPSVVYPSIIPSRPSTTTTTTTTATTSDSDSNQPKINGGSGWTAVSDKIAEASEGTIINVDMNGTTAVPKSILSDIKGKDITLVLDMGDGISWSVNGKNVTSPKDVDLGISADTSAIPVDVINNITGESYNIQLSLAYDGDFGFTAILSIDLGSSNDGLYANLYYYNPKTNAAEFMGSSIIKDGKASLEFTHASDWAIVISEEPVYTDDAASDASVNVEDDVIPIEKTGGVALTVIVAASMICFVLGIKVKRSK